MIFYLLEVLYDIIEYVEKEILQNENFSYCQKIHKLDGSSHFIKSSYD